MQAPAGKAKIVRVDGQKTWISNGPGSPDFYCVFARTSPAEFVRIGSVTARGISASTSLIAQAPGLVGCQNESIVIRGRPLSPPIAFTGCRIPAEQRLWGPRATRCFKLAMRTSRHRFRTSVAGAALGLRASVHVDEVNIKHSLARPCFGTRRWLDLRS